MLVVHPSVRVCLDQLSQTSSIFIFNPASLLEEASIPGVKLPAALGDLVEHAVVSVPQLNTPTHDKCCFSSSEINSITRLPGAVPQPIGLYLFCFE